MNELVLFLTLYIFIGVLHCNLMSASLFTWVYWRHEKWGYIKKDVIFFSLIILPFALWPLYCFWDFIVFYKASRKQYHDVLKQQAAEQAEGEGAIIREMFNDPQTPDPIDQNKKDKWNKFYDSL